MTDEERAKFADDLTDDSPMPFGCHKDKKMSEVPASYLLWLWDDCDFYRLGSDSRARRGVALYISRNFHALETECADRIIEHRP
jgi:hypothetical protein